MTFKKSLVVSTALSAVGMLAAQGAYAAEKPKLSISGYQETYIGISLDRDGKVPTGTPTYQGGSNVHDGGFAIVQYGEIRFTARGTTDNGLKWGVRFEDVQDEADGNRTSDNKKQSTDEAHMWVEGSWGRLEVGGQDGAADRNRSNTADMIPLDRRIPAVWTDTRGTRIRGAEDYGSINDSSDDTKITYWTPRISGFRAAYSWVPVGEARGSVLDAGSESGTFHEFGADYRGNIGGGKLEVAFAWSNQNGAAPDGDNITAWQAGATFSMAGFSVTAGYADEGEQRASNAGEEGKTWDVGVSYEQGPWMVGVAYVDRQHDVQGAADDEYKQITVFGAYNLGGGLSVAGGLFFIDLEDSSTAAGRDNKVTVAAVKLGAEF